MARPDAAGALQRRTLSPLASVLPFAVKTLLNDAR